MRQPAEAAGSRRGASLFAGTTASYSAASAARPIARAVSAISRAEYP